MRHVTTFVITCSPGGRRAILEVDAAETGALCQIDIHKHKTITSLVHPKQEPHLPLKENPEGLTNAFATCPSHSFVVDDRMQEAMKAHQ
jgi:hypothetical protein